MLDKAKQLEADLITWRREFHRYPELGFQETRTANRVAEIMSGLGYRVRTGIGGTGVIAELGTGSPTFAIRAEMDALPIQETNDVPYASQTPGTMHACGHDAHTAMALGTARLLTKEEFLGTVRFLFQPSEEGAGSDGLTGAQRMVADHALDGVDAALALHVDSALPAGMISLKSGPVTAGADIFDLLIHGKGGHGAFPHATIDPIHIAGHAILAIHGIVSRRVNPAETAVITIGRVNSGTADNIIPDTAHLTGTMRYLMPAIQKLMHTELERVARLIESLGAASELKITCIVPPTFTDARIEKLIRSAAVDLIGAEKVTEPELMMGGEDFSYMLEIVPGAWFRLGGKIEGDERFHHNSRFDIDESCLPLGTAILAEAALRFLRSSMQ